MAGAVFCFNPAVNAAVDMFLKIEGVEGESRDKDHVGWIEVQSFSWGMSNSGSLHSGGGGGAGRATSLDLSVGKYLDKTSPILYLRTATGQHFPEVILVLRKAGDETRQKFFEIKLTDVIMTQAHLAGASGGDRPSESISLNFAKIEWTYIPTRMDGTPGIPVSAEWNIAENTAK